tara:strand:+ start:502 stop:753 length:252 start_codon:yes stop_codon:yes gene_type:complete
MKKRRFLGHVSSILQLKAEAEKALEKALEEGHIHGSQQSSGSVYITEAGAKLYLIGTDHTGSSQIYQFRIEDGSTYIELSGST